MPPVLIELRPTQTDRRVASLWLIPRTERQGRHSVRTNQCKKQQNQTTKQKTKTMNLKVTRVLDMLMRIIRFVLDHPITPALPRATAAQAEVTTIITALQAAAQNQTGGNNQEAGGVDLREVYSRDLRNFLKEVNRTARTLEPEHPGISPTFRLPASGSYPALIASAHSIIAAATPIQASFHDAGLPATFIADLNGLLTAFETATAQKHTGGTTQVISTAGLKAKASLCIIAADKLGACVRNHYRGNVEMLAGWETARHIERAPIRSTEETPPPPPPPSGEGSSEATTTSTISEG